MTEPIAYLVAERREGTWMLGEDWAQRCDTLEEAQSVAERWRGAYGDPASVAVLAVTVVDQR